MADQKVLIFGSFTEDEARLFQGKSTQNDHHVEAVKLQFGSLDFASLSSTKDLASQSKQSDSSIRPKDTEAPRQVTNARPCKDGTTPTKSNGSTLSNGAIQKEKAPKLIPKERASNPNGNAQVASNLSNGVTPKEENNIVLGSANETQTSSPEPLTSPNMHYGTLADSSSVPVEESKKILSGNTSHWKMLLPRGLMNPGNLCFLNATLQGLISCSPFVQLLQDLRTHDIPKIGYPILHAFVEFISDFDMPNDMSTNKNGMGVLETGKSFRPAMFDAVLRKFTPDLPSHLTGRPRQEDAQEFLSFVMDQMHDELLKLKGSLSSSNGKRLSLISSEEDDGWETVGPKNKSAVTRTQSLIPSELSAIFGGHLSSTVKARGNKASATIQPFLLLHLDIYPEVVHSVEDALHFFSAPETLEEYRTSAGKAGLVSASKALKLQTLPKLMILHLMRFSYGIRGSTKLHKPIHFPVELVLGRELLVSPSTEGRKYELVATITHHGREPSKGHYTADTKYSTGQWLRYDDASVMAIGVNKVLHDHAYLLFYKQV